MGTNWAGFAARRRERTKRLKSVLKLDPANPAAQAGLERLGG